MVKLHITHGFCLLSLLAGLGLASIAHGQQTQAASGASRINPALFILGEEVVAQQWKATPDLVNIPAYRKQVEPGQCVRFGVELSKEALDKFRDAKLQVEFSANGKEEKIPPEPIDTVKQIKADNGDVMNALLAKSGLKPPTSLPPLSLAVSHSKWCAPADAADSTAAIQAEIVTADGKTVALKPASLAVKTFSTAIAAPTFADAKTLGIWMQHYYMTPDPGQLLPALRLAASDPMLQRSATFLQFLVSAYKASPLAANDAIRRLPQESHATQVYAFSVFGLSGYNTGPLPADFTIDDKTRVARTHLPNAQNMAPDPTIGGRMDMLWSIFFATGDIAPIKKVSSLLAWSADYGKLVEMQKTGVKPKQATPEIMRGVAYITAGWSLSALSRNDGLVADYLDTIKASPDTDPEVRKQLAGLYFNKAFQVKPGKQ